MSTSFDIETLQPKAVDRLRRAWVSQHLAGTYIIAGREQYGQLPLALWCAALANCREGGVADLLGTQSPIPCRRCVRCRAIENLNSPLLKLVVPIASAKNESESIDLTIAALEARRAEPFALLPSAKSQSISIDTIRALKTALAYRPTSGDLRVVIIDQSDKMLPVAADALLKLIEEPPPETIFILLTTMLEVVPITIRSRAQTINLPPIPPAQLAAWLLARFGTEKSVTERLARQSQGSINEAISLLAESRDSDDSPLQLATLFYRSLLESSNPAQAMRIADQIGDDASQFARVLAHWQLLLRDHQRYAHTADRHLLVHDELAPFFHHHQAVGASPRLLHALLDLIDKSLADHRRNVHIPHLISSLSLQASRLVAAER